MSPELTQTQTQNEESGCETWSARKQGEWQWDEGRAILSLFLLSRLKVEERLGKRKG